MTEGLEKEDRQGMPPGVCFPWEEKVRETGPVLGDEATVKNEWESLDAFAYMYLWYWVHR